MSVALDTNILTRAAQPAHSSHKDTLDALEVLKKRGEDLCIVPQNLYEFWVVATRPLAANGLAMSIVEAEAELAAVKKLFRFLNDTQAVYSGGKLSLAVCCFREKCSRWANCRGDGGSRYYATFDFQCR